jgi:hypothetical protein
MTEQTNIVPLNAEHPAVRAIVDAYRGDGFPDRDTVEAAIRKASPGITDAEYSRAWEIANELMVVEMLSDARRRGKRSLDRGVSPGDALQRLMR